MRLTRRQMLRQSGQMTMGLAAAVVLTACGHDDFKSGRGDATPHSRLTEDDVLIMYDTHAMALYMDGSMGPKTGVIKVEQLIAGAPLELRFWHGHGGKTHLFTVTPEHFAALKLQKKVTIETTAVDGHTHKLFIDFSDARWRVPGAQPVPVPKGLL